MVKFLDFFDLPKNLKNQGGIYCITSDFHSTQHIFKVGMATAGANSGLFKRINDYGLYWPNMKIYVCAVLVIPKKLIPGKERAYINSIEKKMRESIGQLYPYEYRPEGKTEWIYDKDHKPDEYLKKIQQVFKTVHEKDLQGTSTLLTDFDQDLEKFEINDITDKQILKVYKERINKKMDNRIEYQVEFKGHEKKALQWIPEIVVRDTQALHLWEFKKKYGVKAYLEEEKRLNTKLNTLEKQAEEMKALSEVIQKEAEQRDEQRGKRRQKRTGSSAINPPKQPKEKISKEMEFLLRGLTYKKW